MAERDFCVSPFGRSVWGKDCNDIWVVHVLTNQLRVPNRAMNTIWTQSVDVDRAENKTNCGDGNKNDINIFFELIFERDGTMMRAMRALELQAWKENEECRETVTGRNIFPETCSLTNPSASV